MSVKLKLALGFSLMLAILIAQGFIARTAFNHQSETIDTIVHTSSAFEALSKEIDISMLMHRRYEKDFFINTGKKEKQAKYKKKLFKESEIMRGLLKQIKETSATIQDLAPETQAKLSEVGPLYIKYTKGLFSVIKHMEGDSSLSTQQANSMMKPYKAAIHDLEEDIALIAKTARELMKKTADQAEASARLETKKLFTLLVSGAAAAILLAIFTTLSIIRPLSSLRHFARQTAAGDFTMQAPKATGEIAQLVQATVQIRTAIEEAIAEVDQIDDSISKGHILKRINSDNFPGEFNTLATRINSVANTFTSFLDSVPAPVMFIDTDYKVLYLNKAGTDAGDAAQQSQDGRQCYDFFCTDDCQTEQCACAQAMQSAAPAFSETTARPGGSQLEIAYTATPIIDRKGKIAGALEIVSDQTAIKQAQKKMLELANQASTISERVSTASEELSAQVEQVSRGADLQRERIGETATAMEQMNATVLEVARNAGQASESAEQAKEQAHGGATIVENTVNAISEVHSATSGLKSNMAILGSQAESIGDVMSVISDIADQTNLLALNAAIEAARAGDAGRGFAVVADEVRKLAEKTMSATSEVGEKIQAIQDASSKNIEGMDVAAAAVENATTMANQSGSSLKGIVQLSQDSAGMVQSIATAAEEQSAASEQINRAVEEINGVIAETADGMAQSAHAVVELSDLTVDLKNLIEGLNSNNATA